MENYSETTPTDLSGFENELSLLIREVEENKKKLGLLEKENEQLRINNSTLKGNEFNYINSLKESERKVQELEKKVPTGLSEKDLAEVMLDAKRVANDIIAKAQEEVVVFERQKEEALKAMKQEGKLIKEDIVNFKMKVDQEMNQWIDSLGVLIGEDEQ